MALNPPQPRPTRMTWTIVVVIDSSPRCLNEVQRLTSLPPGSPVVLELGDHSPHDVDYRVVELARTALHSRDLRLDLRGSIHAVGPWWRELSVSRPTDVHSRHLRLIPGGSGLA